MRISVVLPAPFSPTRPRTSPARNSSDTSSTARTVLSTALRAGPNDFVMCVRRIRTPPVVSRCRF
jgi:hypothetical protein